LPRNITKKETGVYEKEPGSGVWWIRFKSNGVTRREKIGRRGDAIGVSNHCLYSSTWLRKPSSKRYRHGSHNLESLPRSRRAMITRQKD
jgi:hypothetical protein